MIEYKYQKVKGLSEKKFLENGHTMFETDVLQRLKRLAYLEEQVKQGQLLPIDNVSNCDVESLTAEKIWFDIKHSTIVTTEKFGDCFTSESVVRAINKFTK